MFKQSPRRNGRNKGLKIKHVLQICVLLGVSVWLIYQLRHTGAKEPVSVTNVSERLEGEGIKLGRKGLNPKVDKVIKVNDDRREDENVDENNRDEILRVIQPIYIVIGL